MDNTVLPAMRALLPRIARTGGWAAVFVILSASMVFFHAFAAETAETAVRQSPPLPASEVFSWGGYFYGLGALCLILALLYGALWLMRRSGRFRFMPVHTFPRDALRLEAQLPLGPRKGLMVVRFLNKRMLLGVSDQQITLLSEADTHDEPAGADFSKSLEEAARRKTDA